MDSEEKDEFTLEVEARIKAPIEWDSPDNCKIQDLMEDQYDEALRLIKHHYFREEPMCKSSLLAEDKPSVQCYLDLLRTRMKDTTSLVALSVKSDRIIGVAVTKISTEAEKTHTYDRMRILEGDVIKKIMHLKNSLIRQTNVYEKFGHGEYFCVYTLCVHPSYGEKGIEVALLNACVQVAVTLKMPAIGGIFTSGPSQARAASIGFELLSEIRYSQWIVNEQVVFDDPGRGNYTAALMGKLIPLKKDDEDATDEATEANEKQ